MTLQESKEIIEGTEKQIQEWPAQDGEARAAIGALSIQVRQAGLLLFHAGERAWSKRAIDLLLDLADVADGIEIAKEPGETTFQLL